ncbi:hypothetical protein [Herminiimonas sp. CN]|uniref:hypothetical protein n=1 Tax=Herminiimonas sp. CN TaxID=1349818 RepID=UPI00138DD66F|nr:hypothetical protein [Herminiimonas sp. CN]
MVASVLGAVASTVVGSMLADDNGAEDANGAAADATKQQAAIARDQWNTYKETYQPLEKAYVAEAQNYDTPEAYARAAGLASATNSEQYGKARDRLSRTPGLDPSSASYASSMAGLDMSQAASDAVGQNAARNRVSDMAWAHKTDALSLGKGLAANASAGLSSVASTNARMAQNGMEQQSRESAGYAKTIDAGIKAWNNSPGLSDYTKPQRYAAEPTFGDDVS